MVGQKIKSKKSKILIIAASILLLAMSLLHVSGFFFVKDAIDASNSEDFLKEIVPALFAHPSIHLIGLAILGFLSLFLTHDARKILFLLSSLIAIDAILAFYLGGILPGALLMASAICFLIVGLKTNQN